ncbi:MAG TPA: hypothetical protein VK961_22945 [Chthoniobacter sp.]|nr:hypothetical protein [Chthoniobacter sp.]
MSSHSLSSTLPAAPRTSTQIGTGGAGIQPLVEVKRDVRENQVYRRVLLEQSDEFYRRYFGGVPDAMAKLFLVEQTIQATMAPHLYVNDVYRVQVRRKPPVVHLDISRHDGKAITHWRDLQAIKNQLVGPECEGVQLFPADSRLVDTAPQYHLWVIEDPNFRFSFGYDKRVVLPEPIRYSTDTVGTSSRTIPAAGGARFTVPLAA